MRDDRSVPSRRDCLKAAALLGVGASLAPAAMGEDMIPRRPFGKTGVEVSALGIGGHHLGELPDVETAIRLVHEAIDAGVDFFDNCWEYYNGRSENWLGQALEGRRDRVFVMTKVCTHGRGAEVASKMLDESLRRLKTDHLDLWQVHGMSFDNDPALAYSKGGVLEALDMAKKQGKVRFVGFTGHKDPSIHLDMIRRGYPFDAAQMPLNVFDAGFRSFERQVLPDLIQRAIAPLGMKTFNGSAEATRKGLVTAEEMLRYAMSLPVATTITGNNSLAVLRDNIRIARGFKPMTPEAMQLLRDRCAADASDGRFEPYKISLAYDNPEARLAHGFPIDPTIKEIRDMFKNDAGPP